MIFRGYFSKFRIMPENNNCNESRTTATPGLILSSTMSTNLSRSVRECSWKNPIACISSWAIIPWKILAVLTKEQFSAWQSLPYWSIYRSPKILFGYHQRAPHKMNNYKWLISTHRGIQKLQTQRQRFFSHICNQNRRRFSEQIVCKFFVCTHRMPEQLPLVAWKNVSAMELGYRMTIRWQKRYTHRHQKKQKATPCDAY